MDLDHVAAFAAVVEHGGFRPAAEALFVSQPTLTRKIKALEADLGVSLLDRGSWGVSVTPHGAALLAGGQRLSTLVEEVRAAAVGAWGECVRLGANGSTAGCYLGDFLAYWMLQNPEKRLMTMDGGALRLEERLRQGECDIAIIAEPFSKQDFHHLPVRRACVQAILPSGHRLAASPGPLCIDELDDEPLVTGDTASASTALLLSACRIAGVSPRVIYEGPTWQMLATLAEKGLGIAIVGDNLDTRGFDLPIRPLCGHDHQPLVFDLHVAWSRRRQLSPAALDVARGISEFMHGGWADVLDTGGQ